MDVTEIRLGVRAWDEVWGRPVYCSDGDRHKGGVSPDAGSCAERGNLSSRCKGQIPSGRPTRKNTLMRGTGADPLVVVMKPGNAGGAKGWGYSAERLDQPEMGGVHE